MLICCALQSGRQDVAGFLFISPSDARLKASTLRHKSPSLAAKAEATISLGALYTPRGYGPGTGT